MLSHDAADGSSISIAMSNVPADYISNFKKAESVQVSPTPWRGVGDVARGLRRRRSAKAGNRGLAGRGGWTTLYGDLTAAAIITVAGRDDLSGVGGIGDEVRPLMSPVLR